MLSITTLELMLWHYRVESQSSPVVREVCVLLIVKMWLKIL